MAVYTKLEKSEIQALISHYDIGELVEFAEIAEGIENSNYLLTTDKGKYILTIFENRVENFELPFFFELTSHLRERGVACPLGIADNDGGILQDVVGKKAALIEFLEGRPMGNPDIAHIKELGTAVAKMHLAVDGFNHNRKNPLGLRGWKSLFEKIGERADEIQPGLTQKIADELYHLADAWPFGLPGGIIHADIFPDNVFFTDGNLSGIIDFYFACNDYFAYDIAICVNAWGMEKDEALLKAFMGAYQQQRPLSDDELAAMPSLLRGAAMRFLLTRIYDWFNTPDDANVTRKNPAEYLKKLEYWQSNNL